MLQYSYDQLSKIVLIPIVVILLLWTVIIFHKNRKKWAPYDIPIVAILIQSVLRNLAVLIYTVLRATNGGVSNFDYCGVGVWLFNSLHTFQATSLTTLALIGIFSIKLYRKHQNIKQYLTPTHLVYHLFCLTTLCACVGVAAILARSETDSVPETTCLFLPFQLDLKFYVFIMVLHVFLACVSLVSFFVICYHHYKTKTASFGYLKKSTSDLSELSLGLSTIANPHENIAKAYYDTYTIPRGGVNFGTNLANYDHQPTTGCWTSDVSNISTTVSSTNSRRPCLGKQNSEENLERSGLETIHPVLIVSYLFHHVPIIVLCTFPYLIKPWSVSSAGLWLGLLQDLLIPISLGIVDSRFGNWISKVYRCTDRRRIDDKLPQVGLDGKFRPFGSQPQSLEPIYLGHERRILQNPDHKFPITNGSLYTSIDGRLPIIHNYRRPKECRGIRQDSNLLALGLHSTHLKRADYVQKQPNNYICTNCTNKYPTASPKQATRDEQLRNVTNIEINEEPSRYPLRPLLRSSKRLSKSMDTLTDIHHDLKKFKQNPESYQQDLPKNPMGTDTNKDESSSEDEYYPDSMNQNTFDSLSSKSSCSITTEANCDFDFYQSELRVDLSREGVKNFTTNDGNIIFVGNSPSKTYKLTPKVNKKLDSRSSNDLLNFKIKRSNSKRSLENLQAYVDENQFGMLKSNSFVTLDDNDQHDHETKLRNYQKSLDSLEDFGRKTILEVNNDVNPRIYRLRINNNVQYGGSVPDFKKIFISDYI